MRKNIVYLMAALLIVLLIFGAIIINKERNKTNNSSINNQEIVSDDIDFDYQFIKLVDKNNKSNYLISPYSVKVALKLLELGSSGNTKDEINKVLGKFDYTDLNVKDRVSISNAVFIKEKDKDAIKESYLNELEERYKSQVLFDEFKEPVVINNWINEKTNGMIPSILDKIDPSFVLGLANALAIDIEWVNKFDCNLTKEEEFSRIDGSIINTEMMHKSYSYSAKYLEDENAKGIIIPYERYNRETGETSIVGASLEFVGIIPNGNINDYINSQELDKLESTAKEASSNYNINLSLPRFNYSYSLDNFMDVLKELGIKEAMDNGKADFSNMVDKEKLGNNLYLGEAIHKTKIELNENGTKAAAVTYFGMYANGILPSKIEEVDIVFNKPFIYMIRDSKSKEILFFGVVYEPNKWNGSTCSED